MVQLWLTLASVKPSGGRNQCCLEKEEWILREQWVEHVGETISNSDFHWLPWYLLCFVFTILVFFQPSLQKFVLLFLIFKNLKLPLSIHITKNYFAKFFCNSFIYLYRHILLFLMKKGSKPINYKFFFNWKRVRDETHIL